jgi:hypothetical protein
MNITRNLAEGCVMARIMRDAIMYQKNFAVSRYESWEAAEKEGQKWIRKQKKILPPCRMNEEGRMTRRNRSGVVGVYIAKTTRRKPNGKKYEYWKWIARWPDCPVNGGVTWTINEETSDDDAFALAFLSREMRSVDKVVIRRRLSRIYGSKKHMKIMEEKLLMLT